MLADVLAVVGLVVVVTGLVVVVTGLEVVEVVEVVDLEVVEVVGFAVVVAVVVGVLPPLLFTPLENIQTRRIVRSSCQLTVTHRIFPFHSCLRRPRQLCPSSQPGSSHWQNRTRAVHH